MSETMGMTVEQLDDLCRNWPGATRAMKWDVDLVWSVSGKMFVVMCALGPDRMNRVVAQGTPAQVEQQSTPTGEVLRALLHPASRPRSKKPGRAAVAASRD